MSLETRPCFAAFSILSFSAATTFSRALAALFRKVAACLSAATLFSDPPVSRRCLKKAFFSAYLLLKLRVRSDHFDETIKPRTYSVEVTNLHVFLQSPHERSEQERHL